MEEHENLYEKIQEILGGTPGNLKILEHQIDSRPGQQMRLETFADIERQGVDLAVGTFTAGFDGPTSSTFLRGGISLSTIRPHPNYILPFFIFFRSRSLC